MFFPCSSVGWNSSLNSNAVKFDLDLVLLDIWQSWSYDSFLTLVAFSCWSEMEADRVGAESTEIVCGCAGTIGLEVNVSGTGWAGVKREMILWSLYSSWCWFCMMVSWFRTTSSSCVSAELVKLLAWVISPGSDRRLLKMDPKRLAVSKVELTRWNLAPKLRPPTKELSFWGRTWTITLRS